jgi:hypothetical protein
MNEEGKNRESILEQECLQCLYLKGTLSQVPTKNVVMVAGAWGMSGETLNASLHLDRFGKGLQRALREKWKQRRTILNPIKRGKKEKGARHRGMPERERLTWTCLSYPAIIGPGVTDSENMLMHAGTAMPGRKGEVRVKLPWLRRRGERSIIKLSLLLW